MYVNSLTKSKAYLAAQKTDVQALRQEIGLQERYNFQNTALYIIHCFTIAAHTHAFPYLKVDGKWKVRWVVCSFAAPETMRGKENKKPAVKNHCQLWRSGWDSNPRAVSPATRFRVELVMTTSIPLQKISVTYLQYTIFIVLSRQCFLYPRLK